MIATFLSAGDIAIAILFFMLAWWLRGKWEKRKAKKLADQTTKASS